MEKEKNKLSNYMIKFSLFIIICCCFLSVVNSASWVGDTFLNQGLGLHSEASPTVIYNNITQELNIIIGQQGGGFSGYTWNGSGWDTNTSLTNGLSNIATLSSPTLWLEDSNMYIITTGFNSANAGYTWNGSGWDTNTSLTNGLISIGQMSKPTVWVENNTKHMIIGTNSGNTIKGYTWNGSGWDTNTSLTNGYGDIYISDPKPTVWVENNTRYMIVGGGIGQFTGYIWDGTTWIRTNDLIDGLGDIGSRSRPTVWLKDNDRYMIVDNSNGDTYGYIYRDINQYFRFNETSNSSYITNYTFGDYSSNETYTIIPYYELNEGYNELLFNAVGYVPTTYNFTSTNSTQLNVTYNTTYIRLYLNIYDRDTESLITQNVDIDLVGDSFAGEFSTSNGTITIHNISFLPDDYILTFESDGYSDNTYLFTYTGYNEMNYSIYLQNSTPTTEVRVVVRDLFYNNLENCNVKAKQYFLSSNNYIMVDSGTTNSNGEVLFNLDTDKTFQFVTTCDGETQTETGQKIITTPVYIYFGGDNELTLFNEIPSISYNLTWTNTSDNNGYFRYEYNDQNAVISQGCLYIYEITGIDETLINSSCVASTSATININLNMDNNTQYIAKSYVTYNSNDRLVDTYTISNYISNDVFMAGLDLLISVAVVMIFILIGVALHPYASVLFGIFGLFVMFLLGFIQIAQSFIIGLLVIVIGVILWRSRR